MIFGHPTVKIMVQTSCQSDQSPDKDLQAAQLLTAFQRKLLNKMLNSDVSEKYHQRIEIMLMADQGKTQTQICETLGCSQATARHWILMARTGQAHLWQEQPIGRPKAVNEEYVARLKELVSQSPKAVGYPFRRWTGQWLSKHLAQEFGITVSDRHINRLLKSMGLSTRPQAAEVTANTSGENKGNRIAIRDLSTVEGSEVTNVNFFQLPHSLPGDIEVEIHGSAGITAICFTLSAQQYVGLCPISERV